MEIEKQNKMYHKEILGLRKHLDILKKENFYLKDQNEKLKEVIKKREKRANQRAGNIKKQN